MNINNSLQAWVCSGDIFNWKKALSDSMWGLSKGNKSAWSKVGRDHLLFFYCTDPVSKIFGYSKVNYIFESNELYWEDEIKCSRSLWPLRLKYELKLLLPEELWITHGIGTYDYSIYIKKGINPLMNKDIIEDIIINLKKGADACQCYYI